MRGDIAHAVNIGVVSERDGKSANLAVKTSEGISS